MPLARLCLAISPLLLGAAPVSFEREVIPVLSRAGCNQGACHGNLNGKGGFKLSLRGEDPVFDLQSLSRDMLGRRGDIQRPTASLILQKATCQIPHEGGKRIEPNSPEFEIIANWMGQGMLPDPPGSPTLRNLRVSPELMIVTEPSDSFRITVTATFSNGQSREVTNLSWFESSNPTVADVSSSGLVRKAGFGESSIAVRYLGKQATVRVAFVPTRADFRWPNPPEVNYIDILSFQKLRALRVAPSELVDDSTFIRRVYLDTLGILPTADEVRRFLADSDDGKRASLIDRLLKRNEFADFWALKWSDLLRNEEHQLDRKGVQAFHNWIRKSIADKKPLNEFARELIASRGSTYAEPASNYYRALRDPLIRAEATAQVFLGIRIACARCHNHPFDRWTMADYYGFAAYFPRVRYKILDNNRRDRLDKHEFDGEQIVWMDRTGETLHPRDQRPVAPKFLDSDKPSPTDDDRLRVLADWIASPANPYFARTQVNRIWYHLFGRGLVDPDDDFRATNPPSHPELLEALAADFVKHNFDLRHLIRQILNSRTYQLASTPTSSNRDDEINFARAYIQPLQAEQLLDALGQVTGKPPKFEGYPQGIRAGQLPGVQQVRARGARTPDSERFLKMFGKPDRLLSCDCERSDDTTLVQAFQLITGDLLNNMLSAPDNRLGQMLSQNLDDSAILEELYLSALCRRPTSSESAAALQLLKKSKNQREAWEDILWGILNSKEFLLRR